MGAPTHTHNTHTHAHLPIHTGTGTGARTTQPKKKAVKKTGGGGSAKGVASTGRVVVSASTRYVYVSVCLYVSVCALNTPTIIPTQPPHTHANTHTHTILSSSKGNNNNDNGGRHVILNVLGAKRRGGAAAGAGGSLNKSKIQKINSNNNRVTNPTPRLSRPAKALDSSVGWESSSSSLGSSSKTNKGSSSSSSTSGKCATAVATAKVIVGAGNHPKKNDIKQVGESVFVYMPCVWCVEVCCGPSCFSYFTISYI